MQGSLSSQTTSPPRSPVLSSAGSRLSPIPRSMLATPLCGYHSTEFSGMISSPKSQSDFNRKQLHPPFCISQSDEKPRTVSKWQLRNSESQAEISARKDKATVYHVRKQGSEGGSMSIFLMAEGKSSRKSLEEELRAALKDANEKGSAVIQLKNAVFALEQKLRGATEDIQTLKRENQTLSLRLQTKESEMKTTFDGEIDRLSRILAENSQKFAKITEKLHESEAEKRSDSAQSDDLCLFLIEENKQLSEELKTTKYTLQSEFVSLLTSLTAELATIRCNLSQLRVLLTSLRTGEAVNMSELLKEGKDRCGQKSVDSLTGQCMREVEAIKKCVCEMKTLASDFYAQNCGEVCSTQ